MSELTKNEILKEINRRQHSSYVIETMINEISKLSCPETYEFEGIDTYSDCGKCLVCIATEIVAGI